jgi:hypothetical protein
MEQTPIEILDPILLKRMLFTAIGLFSCFMGLWIYKSTINATGFLVGVGYAAYATFTLLTKTHLVNELTDIQFLLLLAGVMLVGGFIGMFLARAFEFIIFFLAGGIVALVLSRLWMGTITPQDFQSLDTFRDAIAQSSPTLWDILVFFIGGILYIFNIRFILAITTAAIGGLCLRWVWGDVLSYFHPHLHDIVAVVLMVFGTLVQMKTFKGRREILPPRYRRTDFEKI